MAGALLLVVALVACQKVDGGRSPEQGAEPPAAVSKAAPPEPVSSSYPSLSSVPRRPQLTYTVAQRRKIVEGLVADLENARYTDRVVRYRSGLSALPPPPPPAGWRVAEVATAQAEELVPEAPPAPEESEDQTATLPAEVRQQVYEGDDSLDDFVTELAESTEAQASSQEQAGAAMDETDDGAATQGGAPWREPRSLVGWWDLWFGDDGDDAPAGDDAAAMEPSAAPDAGVEPMGGPAQDMAVDKAVDKAVDTAVVRGASMVRQGSPEARDGQEVGAPPSIPAGHGGQAPSGLVAMLSADPTLGTPARLMPDPSWPTTPPPRPSPSKPVVTVVQPIPEPAVPIDVEDGLLSLPVPSAAEAEAAARPREDAGVWLIRAGR